MTPRSVSGYNASQEFARQVAEHKSEQDGQPPMKKFKSSVAPKGTKLASGYHDRTLARRAGEAGEETQDDKEKRLKALEEMFKLQQIDEATFETLKREIGIGGNIGSTHLVKGLDWKLLERVRRGEDINKEPASAKESEAPEVDVDDELDQILKKDVQAKIPTSQKEQADSTATDHHDGQPMTRDEILRRLKEGRIGKQPPAALGAPAPALGDRFKKVSSEKSNKKKFVEVVNGRRREVLVITTKDGKTKRKTRWINPEEKGRDGQEKEPLGMEVPAEILAKQQALLEQQAAEEDEDDDIFQGIGDYDPLAGIHSDSDQSDGEKKAEQTKEGKGPNKTPIPSGTKPRNYFSTGNQPTDEVEDRANPIAKDPTLLAALKRAAALQRNKEDGGDEAIDLDPDRAAKHKQMLARVREQERADAADMDLGFGGSRFEDEDEEGGVWDEGEGEGMGKGKKSPGRKRGKKRKGDKDNVNDVMAVLEGRGKKSP